MKVGKIINLLILIVVTFLFIGCQDSEQINTDNSYQQKDNGIQSSGNSVQLIDAPHLSTEELLEVQSKLAEVVATGDKEKCKELKYNQFFSSCEVNILANSAENAEDLGVCDGASNNDIKEKCAVLVSNKQ